MVTPIMVGCFLQAEMFHHMTVVKPISISLLDIVFKQLMLNLDAPSSLANYMAKLHICSSILSILDSIQENLIVSTGNQSFLQSLSLTASMLFVVLIASR